ncbi:10659_t:CDS:1, partial [Cetraspora pellucida]
LDNINIEVQQLVAYILLEKMIKFSFKQFKQLRDRQNNNEFIIDQTESWTISQNIIILESYKASKFLYIIGCVIYKLIKSDLPTMMHQDFIKIRLCLSALSTENVEYEFNTCSKKTTIILGAEFIQYMYYLKLLVLQLFEKHNEYEFDILIYINDYIINNQPLKEQFHTILQKLYEHQYYINNENHLSEE